MPRAEDYEHQPIEQLRLEWDREINGRKPEIDIFVHPNDSGRIIINYPGWNGDIDGFNDKHRKLAQYMQGEGLGAVVRGKGPGHPDLIDLPVDLQLRMMIRYSLEYSQEIAKTDAPELLLIGTSAGGGAAATIAHEYPEVSRILLMAPGANGNPEVGLPKFRGEVHIVIGANDDVVSPVAGKYFYDLATGASRRNLFTISDCNHQFHGELNGRIMSEAPFYAFSKGDRPIFPDPQGGMVLY